MTERRSPLVEPAETLEPAEARRYDRHLLLGEIGLAGQLRLKNARVLVVGAGGLGSPALAYLAAAGVGTLGIVDDDVVEESNLHRQIAHGQSDLGRSKVESAAESVAEWNPFVTVRPHPVRITAENATAIVADYDLVLDGTDNFATRYLLNDVCGLGGIPYLWASILRFDGQVGLAWAGHGPCLRCLFPEPPPAGMVPSCAEGGVLGVLCASIGAAQATEAIRLITGAGTSILGSLQLYEALTGRWTSLAVERDPACSLCGDAPTITAPVDYAALCGLPTGEASQAPVPEVSAEELAGLLADREAGRTDFVLVDVRTADEAAVSSIPGSVLVPVDEITADDGLERLPTDRSLVLYCRSGQRSTTAARHLIAAGHRQVRQLAGGILAWPD